MIETDQASAAAEAAARASYGKLIAWLAWKWRDVCAAEDALSEAFATALQHWPKEGVPAVPEAWLLTVAKRHLLMAARRKRLEEDPAAMILLPDLTAPQTDVPGIPDVRLRLLFVCAHPAIDSSMHSALMLQLVLGLDASQIANAFLVSPAALAKRLTRAKAKIRDAGIPFDEPEKAELVDRVDSVLEAIYGMYSVNGSAASDARRSDLAEEALFLAMLASDCLPGSAEAHGLCALLLYCESRRFAHRDAKGRFIPLDEQIPQHWRQEMIADAEAHLAVAAKLEQPGPYQIEAAIQAAHMHGIVAGCKPWCEISSLYEQLLQLDPTIGARIGHAVASAYASESPSVGLALLDAIEPSRIAAHQPWWASRARLLAMAGRKDESTAAYERAIALTGDVAIQNWLRRCAERP